MGANRGRAEFCLGSAWCTYIQPFVTSGSFLNCLRISVAGFHHIQNTFCATSEEMMLTAADVS